jgi:hypothetical protein
MAVLKASKASVKMFKGLFVHLRLNPQLADAKE